MALTTRLSLLLIMCNFSAVSQSDYFVGFFARPIISDQGSPGHAFVIIGKGNPLNLDLNSNELKTFGLYPVRGSGVIRMVLGHSPGEIRQETKAQIAAGVEPYYFQYISRQEYDRIQQIISDYTNSSAGLDYQGLTKSCVHFTHDVASSLTKPPVVPDKVSFRFPTEYMYALFMLNDPYGKQYRKAYELLVKSIFDNADSTCTLNCTGQTIGKIISGRFRASSFLNVVSGQYATPAEGVHIIRNSNDWLLFGKGNLQDTHNAAQTFANSGKLVVALYGNNIVIITPGQLVQSNSWQKKVVSISSYDDESDQYTFVNGLISKRFGNARMQDVSFYLYYPQPVVKADYLGLALEAYKVWRFVFGAASIGSFALREFFRAELTVTSDQELDQFLKNLNRKTLSDELRTRGMNEQDFLTKLDNYLLQNSSSMCDDQIYSLIFKCDD